MLNKIKKASKIQRLQQSDIQNNPHQKDDQLGQKSDLQIIVKKQQNQKIQQSTYRADIDGLRTIAVVIVVIFHAWPDFMTGGFIGVDVFFVISGYLISGIIIKQTKSNKFSYANFYSRRIKRIYPALIFMLFIVLMFVSKFLETRQKQIVTHTMAASTIFGANLQILTYQKGYFDPQIKTNGLLHLWSLGVQEQFYIIWPCFLSVVVNTFTKKGFFVLILFTIFSFIFSIYSVYDSPKFAFYFPLSRFWQMAVGGIIAYSNKMIKNKILSNLSSILGLSCILITIWYVNEDSLFPGYWALIPTFSATLIILGGSESLTNKYILSTKLFVFIGKISYPLYLWHWPLLVYSRMMYPPGSSSIFAKTWVVVLISLFSSIFTYFVIEKPLRFRKSKFITYLLLMTMLTIGSVALFGINKQTNSQISQFDSKKNTVINQFLIKQKGQKQQKNKIESKQQISQFNIEIWKKQINKTSIDNNKNINPQQHKKSNDSSNQKMNISNTQKKQYQKTIKPRINATNNSTNKPTNNPYINILQNPNIDLPTQEDFYYKNGRKHINSSKNKKRKPPQKDRLNLATRFQHNTVFPNRVSYNSSYFDPIVSSYSQFFQILNEGKNNKLFIVGDSHAQVIRNRFQFLYEESIKNNKTNEFPTIVSMVRCGMPYVQCHNYFNSTFAHIKKHKPNKVLIVNHWYLWLQYGNKTGPKNNWTDCYQQYADVNRQSYQDVVHALNNLKNTITQFKALGIQTYVAGINPQGTVFNPRMMFDFSGVIQNNVKSISLSQFKKKHKQKMDLLQSTVKNAGGHMIDFTDNQCWQDTCELFTPQGQPIIRDNDHFRYQFAKYWISSVDFLVQF